MLLPVYLLFATERFSTLARLLSWVGFATATLPAVVMLARPRSRLCGVAAVGLVIAVFYQLAVFHEERLMLRWGEARLSERAILLAHTLSALATPALWLGWGLFGLAGSLRGRLLPRPRLEVPDSALLLFGALIFVAGFLTDILWVRGELTTYQPLVSVINVLTPSELGLAMVLLPTLREGPLSERNRRRARLLFFALASASAVMALTRGMILIVVRPLIIYLLGHLYVRRKVQLLPVVLGVAAVLILQPVKAEFRARVWDRQVELGVLERASLYLELVGKHWIGSDFEETKDALGSVRTAAARTGWDLALANVVELTPASIPHQWGQTYKFLLYAPVPRVIYPEKPVAQQADIWAAVAYGYITERGTAHVSIGLSQLAESYVNFGIPLCFLFLMLIGALQRAVDEMFTHRRAGSGALAIYLYCLQAMITSWESSFAQFWGGVLQLLIVYGTAMALLSFLGTRATRALLQPKNP